MALAYGKGSVSFNRQVHITKEILDVVRLCSNLLRDQTSDTIDDFIAMNPSVADVVKVTVSWLFFTRLYRLAPAFEGSSEKVFRLRRVEARRHGSASGQEPGRRNWTHQLINMARHGIAEGHVDQSNGLRIISFNYDGILETVLSKQFANAEAVQDYDWEDYIQIVHPHGFMGEMDDEVREPLPIIRRWAESIAVIGEAEDTLTDEVNSARATSRRWIGEAVSIYAAGFSFSATNCRRVLKPESSQPRVRRRLSYLNYDGSRGVERAAERFAKEVIGSEGTAHREGRAAEVHEARPPQGEYAHIDEWFAANVPGETPS